MKGRHLKPARIPDPRRSWVSIGLTTPEYQAIYAAARVRARTADLTISSLVIQALAEYMERHPAANHD